jgi:NAD(P)H-dependent FMN reductase
MPILKRTTAFRQQWTMPGVFKNAVDWLSRPPADIPRVFGGKPVAIMGASPGGFGTVLGQNAWLPVVRALGMEPWFGGRLMVSRANGVFDETGAMTDDGIREQLQRFISGFEDFTRTFALISQASSADQSGRAST